MTHCEVVPVTEAHIVELARTMREADKAEIALVAGLPYEVLKHSVAGSRDALTGLYDGKVVAIFGICTENLLADKAVIWMLTSSEIEKHPTVYLRLAKRFVAVALSQYKALYNFVDERNVVAIRWLEWLGFQISDQRVPLGEGFVRFFSKERSDV